MPSGSEQTWRGKWRLIYHYVALNALRHECFPLPAKFWWGGRHLDARKPFAQEIIDLGPEPPKGMVDALIGGMSGDVDTWLRRRATQIERLQSKP